MSDRLAQLIRDHSPHAKVDRAEYEKELLRIAEDPVLFREHLKRVNKEISIYRNDYSRDYRHLRDIVFMAKTR